MKGNPDPSAKRGTSFNVPLRRPEVPRVFRESEPIVPPMMIGAGLSHPPFHRLLLGGCGTGETVSRIAFQPRLSQLPPSHLKGGHRKSPGLSPSPAGYLSHALCTTSPFDKPVEAPGFIRSYFTSIIFFTDVNIVFPTPPLAALSSAMMR